MKLKTFWQWIRCRPIIGTKSPGTNPYRTVGPRLLPAVPDDEVTKQFRQNQNAEPIGSKPQFCPRFRRQAAGPDGIIPDMNLDGAPVDPAETKPLGGTCAKVEAAAILQVSAGVTISDPVEASPGDGARAQPLRVPSTGQRMEAAKAPDPPPLDWLVYLSEKNGTLSLLERAFDSLEAMRQRVEENGHQLWLDLDHDALTKMYLVSAFRLLDGKLFVGGEWTAKGRELRHLYKGQSFFGQALWGDFEVATSITHPSAPGSYRDLPQATQDAYEDPEQSVGLIGACCCIDSLPCAGITGIFRLIKDENIGRERMEPAGGVHLIDFSPAIKPKTQTPKQPMNFILQKSFTGAVVLVSDWAPMGAQHQASSTLPHQKAGATARQFAIERLLHPKGKPGEPGLTCDDPDKLTAMAWEFITTGMSPETLAFAEVYYELRSKGVELPPIKFGPSRRVA